MSDNTPKEPKKPSAAAIAAIQEVTEHATEAGRKVVQEVTHELLIEQIANWHQGETHYKENDNLKNLNRHEVKSYLAGVFMGHIEGCRRVAAVVRNLDDDLFPQMEKLVEIFAKNFHRLSPAEITISHAPDCTCGQHGKPTTPATPEEADKAGWKTPGSTGVKRGTTPTDKPE